MIRGLKSKIRNGEPTIGTWVTLAHPAIAEIAAKAGFDWVAIDLEHSVITIREVEELIRVVAQLGVVPLIRLTSHDPDLIKRVMDAGAHGVIAPMVNSVDDASAIIQALYYPPIGQRGVGLARAQSYGAGFKDYIEWINHEAIFIAQIEHHKAVDQLSAILAVSEVDGFIIGPYDLSASMGIPGQFQHPEFVTKMQLIDATVRNCEKSAGVHIVEPRVDELEDFKKRGYRFLAYSLDTRILDLGFRQGIKAVK